MTASTVEYALMAGAAYVSIRRPSNRISSPKDWNPLSPILGLDHRQDDTSGFEAVAFARGNEIVISFAGTYGQFTADKLTDAALRSGTMTPQLREAAEYYQDIKRAFPGAQISFTGHSLGGGLAVLMGVASDDGATFDLTTASDLNAFHIKLVDESAIQPPANYDRTIVGDLTPVDFDPNTAGIQTRTDDLGNVIVDSAQPQPGRADGLQDGAGNETCRARTATTTSTPGAAATTSSTAASGMTTSAFQLCTVRCSCANWRTTACGGPPREIAEIAKTSVGCAWLRPSIWLRC